MGLIGRKCGMTRVFDEAGQSTPVSVIEVLPNKVVQIKNSETDGYSAVQVTMGERRASRVTKPLTGHYAKAKVEPGLSLVEFRMNSAEEIQSLDAIAPGQVFNVSLFSEGQYVDVVGTSRGKGFAGTIKRHNFASQDASHGNSVSHRTPGSIGQNQSPGRVFKGKKMAGHMGDVRRTVQSLKVIKVDAEKNLILVKGAIPGAPGNQVIIKPAVKKASVRGGNDGA